MLAAGHAEDATPNPKHLLPFSHSLSVTEKVVHLNQQVQNSASMAQIVQQPRAATETNWHSGLFDCFEDTKTCCYGFWCCPCLACTVSGRFGENQCLPLCDMCTPAITSAFGIPLCAPPALLSLRAAMRHKYNIKGSLCDDIAISCFCVWCAWCQMHRELRHRKKIPTVVNVHAQTTVNMQPIPVMMTPVYAPQAGFVTNTGIAVVHQ